MKNNISFFWLVSILLSCNHTQRFTIPYFPETSNPYCQVVPILLDTSFFPKRFLISPDKKHVFVWGERLPAKWTDSIIPPPSVELSGREVRLFQLDKNGLVQATVDFPVINLAWNFWWTENAQLAVLTQESIDTYDASTLELVEECRIRHDYEFLSEKQRNTLNISQLDDLYQGFFQQAIRQSKSAYVLLTPERTRSFLVLHFTNKPAEAWYLQSPQEIKAYIAQFGLRQPVVNPNTRFFVDHGDYDDKNGHGKVDTILDGWTLLRHYCRLTTPETTEPAMEEDKLFGVEIFQREKKLQAQHIATVQLDNNSYEAPTNYSYRLQVADNFYLTTANDAIWLLSCSKLYFLKMGG